MHKILNLGGLGGRGVAARIFGVLIESVLRSLKSELGLRPVYHSKESRVDGHLFITVLAYQCVQLLRTHLKGERRYQRPLEYAA